ncbi:venom allergen 3-like [Neocloeon triangulifer]|uniref:venom allergen 3-like n=1 Tax=Neocloeon triangulifer TaxID=2078957 RepID=UPI00286F72E1|nr:venom allergen 3-like [Neocloeon triangulifer]
MRVACGFVTILVILHLGNPCTDRKYENFGHDHTMCMEPKKCNANKKLIEINYILTAHERAALLDIHNKLRALVAFGRIPGHPPARNMQQLTWDDELASVAQRWAEQCMFEHDKNRRVERFRVGQNLAFSWQSPPNRDKSADVINSTIAMFNEVNKPGFPSAYIGKFQPVPKTGHYTQIVWAESTLIGCGHAIYSETKKNIPGETKLLVCNFGRAGNMIGAEVYKTGMPECEVPSNHYTGLCTTKDVNTKFEDPCDKREFNALYPALCDNDLFEALGIYGITPSMNKWLLGSILFISAAGFLGLLYFTYCTWPRLKLCKRT